MGISRVRHAVWIAAGLGTAACSGEQDACELQGLKGSSTCAEQPPAPGLIRVADEGACITTHAFGCDDEGNCGETHQRECPGGVVEKAIEPGCFKDRTTFSFIIGDPSLPSSDGRFVPPTPADLWQPGLDRMNQLLDDGGSPRLRLASVEELSGPRQGPLQFPFVDIREFRVIERGTIRGFESASGLAQCTDDEDFGRINCRLDLVMENITRASRLTGSSVEDIKNVVALHELGHALCIQHLSQDPTLPSAGPVFTAMNNAVLSDGGNPATRYFTLDPSEVASVREASQTRPPPGTVFSRGFNTD